MQCDIILFIIKGKVFEKGSFPRSQLWVRNDKVFVHFWWDPDRRGTSQFLNIF